MATGLHKNLTGEDIHIIHRFTFADASARAAGTGYTLTAADQGKVARQTDNDSFWVLVDDSPITWAELTGGGVTDHGALSGLGDDDHTQYQLESEKGASNGYASLDGTTKVPIAQIPVINDSVHGNRGGGALHANATTSVAGFMSDTDKTKLDGIASGATNTQLTNSAPANVTKATAAVGVATDAARADHKHDITTAAASTIGTSNSEGSATSLARSDHGHDHGSQSVGTHHAVTIPSVNGAGGTNGFMEAFDKEKVNNFKVPCRAATTANITLSGPQTIDGVSIIAGDRVLVRAQSTTTANGIYDCASGAWTRSFDCDTTGDITTALVVQVKEGTLFNNIFFTSDTNPIFGVDPIAFSQLSGVPGSATPTTISTSSTVGTSVKFSREDHGHAHGVQTDGTLHADTIPSVSGVGGTDGFMPALDKEKIDQYKIPCRVATTANITLSGAQTIDGVSVIAGDRVLVKNQSTASQNGMYNCAAGAWTRTFDADTTGELTPDTVVMVREGSVFGHQYFCLTNTTTPTIGSDSITWTIIGGVVIDGDKGDITVSANGATWTIDNDAISNAKLRNSGATSVIGRSANSTGDPADITASTNGHVLRRVNATLAFGESPNSYDLHGGSGDLLVPGTGWNITAQAPTTLDSVDTFMQVARFDDTTEEGRGWYCYIPAGATEMKVTYVSRAQTAPAATRTVGIKLSYKRIQHNTSMPAWATHTLSDISLPASALWQVQSQTFALTAPTTDLVAGEFYGMEISRINPTAGTELVGDWTLHRIRIEFF